MQAHPMTYTYEQAIAYAPKHVKRRSDLPTKSDWYMCEDGYGYAIRWFNLAQFSVNCDQCDAENSQLDNLAKSPTVLKILGWCEPWWPQQTKGTK